MAILYAVSHPDRARAIVLFNAAARYLVADDFPIGYFQEVVDGVIELVRTLWGRPIEGFHCMESPGDHPCQFEGLPPGYCNQKVGHFAEGTPHRCSKCSFTWGGKPTNKERSIRKEKKRGE